MFLLKVLVIQLLTESSIMKKLYLLCTAFIIILSLHVVVINAQPTTWQARGVGGGGALFFPTINPANDNEFYVSCDMSQIFHSTDFGASYTQVSFTKLQTGNVSTYEFTNNSNNAYCIANDGNINYGVRTTDGGNTWTPLPGNPDNTETVYALKADYANPGRLIMNYYGSLYISNDYGDHFSLAWAATNAGAGITMGGVFFDGNNIYIGTNEGILYSSNGGTSFSKLATSGMPADQAIFSFAGAKAGGITRFFCITANTAEIYNGIYPWEYYIVNDDGTRSPFYKGVYSLDAGTNIWVSKLNGINTGNDFMMYVGMAHNDINTVYLGGNDNTTGGNSVIKTSDAGASWTKVFITPNNQNIRTGWSGQGGDRGWGYGESCFGISVAPNNANKVLFGDFGFVHKTSDGGVNWEQAYVNTLDEHAAGSATPTKQYYHSIGLENTTSWQLYWSDANNIFSCYSDIKGIRSKDAGVTWGFDYTGHTANSMYRIAKQATGTTMFAATSDVHDMYQSTRLKDDFLDPTDAEGKIIYSTNNGAAWQLLHQFGHPVFWVATDPNNANRMYASVIDHSGGTGGIWMTNDLNNLAASTWTKLANPPRTEGHPASIAVLNDGKMVCTFSGRRTSSAFTASSGVFLYNPATNLWTDVSDAGMQYWTKDIVIDPSDAAQNTWYVAVFSGWGGAPNGKGGLYKTTNRGANWTKLTGTQFDRVTSITFNPSINKQAYLTTETQGLWISNDMDAATPTWTLVDAYPFRQPERVFFNPFKPDEIWVSSFGNGLKMGIAAVALPVRLLSFTGNRYNNISTLQWSVTGGEASSVFSVERSTDGLHFTSIGKMPCLAGDNNYQYKDTIGGNILYYRIATTNLAGSMSYSNVVILRDVNAGTNNIRLLGNPVYSNNIKLEATLYNADILNIRLMNVSGKTMMQKVINAEKGLTQISWALPADFANGVYVLQISSNQINESIRIVLSK